jgi:hypothetical protein
MNLGSDPNRRPRRVPFTREEIQTIVAHKARQKEIQLQKFIRSNTYKVLNILNIICFSVYLELLFCFFGPSIYEGHYSYKINAFYDYALLQKDRKVVSELDVFADNGITYKFMVNGIIDIPEQRQKFYIGKDYLLGRELKGRFENSNTNYRLFSASPLIFFCFFLMAVSLLAYFYDLNQFAHSLYALTALNLITVSGMIIL